MEKLKLLALALLLGGGVTALAGCEEGAFEETGEEIDDAADELEDER
jgi:tRNA A37 threonylcarbamoyltransferase TsaD